MLGKKIVMKITYGVEDILMLKKREKKIVLHCNVLFLLYNLYLK